MVNAFINGFSKECKFYTNYDGSFACISNSFLDVAIIMEDNDGVTGFVSRRLSAAITRQACDGFYVLTAL
ncbi:hypothetical protein [Pseudoalteromonas denitrificans]|uniref:Uncharacterized protein n=1 Tax=Pseudoalteromonas denitrificans DSM 6059 TaxID=1123010 RepID=A0A1I1KHX8_9GAMM|nr:hypothetical protein [Pseudoalteromonas denitrificans]SFC57030.1 hypothetical protein SAMN02745724_01984 [Pseudoalteromonas denitrificans DSM 6059]